MLLTNAENGGDGAVYIDNVELNLISLPFKPQTKEELQTAVDLWENDNVSALNSYGEIDLWDVSLVTDMSALFEGKANFNNDIYSWDVSNVTNMQSMFLGASSFNQDISTWDVSNVTSLDEMFQSAVSFNKDLSDWDVSSAVTISGMFPLFRICGIYLKAQLVLKVIFPTGMSQVSKIWKPCSKILLSMVV